jgi:hypothetical protein
MASLTSSAGTVADTGSNSDKNLSRGTCPHHATHTIGLGLLRL